MGNMIAAEASVKHEKPAGFSLSDTQIDEILRTGGGMGDSRMRMSEVKKVRKRVSMKKLLAEKKAEVAEREKKPPEVGAPSKRPSMGVDD